MAWTPEHAAAVRSALARGVRTVRFSDGRSVENQSAADMLVLLDRMEAEIAAASPNADLCRTTFTSFARD